MSGIFENLEMFDEGDKVATRQALAVANKRFNDQFGEFLRNASTKTEFTKRLALVERDITNMVDDVAYEYDGDAQKIAKAIKTTIREAADRTERLKSQDEVQEADEHSQVPPWLKKQNDDEDQEDGGNRKSSVHPNHLSYAARRLAEINSQPIAFAAPLAEAPGVGGDIEGQLEGAPSAVGTGKEAGIINAFVESRYPETRNMNDIEKDRYFGATPTGDLLKGIHPTRFAARVAGAPRTAAAHKVEKKGEKFYVMEKGEGKVAGPFDSKSEAQSRATELNDLENLEKTASHVLALTGRRPIATLDAAGLSQLTQLLPLLTGGPMGGMAAQARGGGSDGGSGLNLDGIAGGPMGLALNNLPGGTMKNLGEAAGNAGDFLGDAATLNVGGALGDVAKGVGNVAESIPVIGPALESIFGSFATLPPKHAWGFSDLVENAGKAVGDIAQTGENAVSTVGDAANAIGQGVDAAGNAIGQGAAGAAHAVGQGVGDVVQTGQNAINTIGEGAESGGRALGEGARGVADWGTGAVNDIGNAFNQVGNQFGKGYEEGNRGNDITDKLLNVPGQFGKGYEQGNRGKDIPEKIISGTHKEAWGFGDLVENAGKAVGDIAQTGENAVSTVGDAANAIGQGVDAAGNAIGQGVDAAGNAINQGFGAGAELAGKAVGDIAQTGQNAINTIGEGAEGAGRAVGQGAKGVADWGTGAVNDIGNAFGQMGGQFEKGYGEGNRGNDITDKLLNVPGQFGKGYQEGNRGKDIPQKITGGTRKQAGPFIPALAGPVVEGLKEGWSGKGEEQEGGNKPAPADNTPGPNPNDLRHGQPARGVGETPAAPAAKENPFSEMHEQGQTFGVGDTGAPVKQIQQALGVKADGVYGPQTAQAVTDYQAKNGLTQDGAFGAQTASSLAGGKNPAVPGAMTEKNEYDPNGGRESSAMRQARQMMAAKPETGDSTEGREKLPKGNEDAHDGPSPKIDKKKWKPNALNENGNLKPIDTEGDKSPHPTRQMDIKQKPDYQNNDPWEHDNNVWEREQLPTADDNAGFDGTRNIEQHPTKTFPDKGQTNPVTNVSLPEALAQRQAIASLQRMAIFEDERSILEKHVPQDWEPWHGFWKAMAEAKGQGLSDEEARDLWLSSWRVVQDPEVLEHIGITPWRSEHSETNEALSEEFGGATSEDEGLEGHEHEGPLEEEESLEEDIFPEADEEIEEIIERGDKKNDRTKVEHKDHKKDDLEDLDDDELEKRMQEDDDDDWL